jgi:hypothetical protein
VLIIIYLLGLSLFFPVQLRAPMWALLKPSVIRYLDPVIARADDDYLAIVNDEGMVQRAQTYNETTAYYRECVGSAISLVMSLTSQDPFRSTVPRDVPGLIAHTLRVVRWTTPHIVALESMGNYLHLGPYAGQFVAQGGVDTLVDLMRTFAKKSDLRNMYTGPLPESVIQVSLNELNNLRVWLILLKS